jgi:hypothetical protein
LNCKWVFTRWQWYYNKTQHTNTHITQNNTPCSNKTQHTELHTTRYEHNTSIADFLRKLFDCSYPIRRNVCDGLYKVLHPKIRTGSLGFLWLRQVLCDAAVQDDWGRREVVDPDWPDFGRLGRNSRSATCSHSPLTPRPPPTTHRLYSCSCFPSLFVFCLHPCYFSLPSENTTGRDKKTKLCGMSPRANYIDRATAACWRS